MLGASMLQDDVPPPCNKCKHTRKCAIQPIACVDFYRYVQLDDEWPSSKVRKPTHEYYNRIYRISGYERNRTNTDGQTSSSDAAVDPANRDLVGV